MSVQEGPLQWMWGLCKGLCCRCCCAGKKRGRLKVHEVTAKDYMHQKKKVKARLREDNMTKATLRSFGGYSIGMLLITIYAGIVLFVKNYNLWYCLISTITTGFFLTLGMGFSKRVRITVLLMLPSFFSSQGKNFLLLMAFAMALQGPVANVLENFRRSTKALSCGVELAINQTKDLLEKIKRPLISTLNYIKKIGRNLKKASDMIRKFFKTIMTGIKFIGRSLRRVWHFIANMGEICNEEMEAPYIKCKKLFDEGKRKCQKVMTFLAFLCFIVDIFRPLCGLAKVIVLLCIIPFYVNKFIQKCIKNPVMALLNKVKMKFEFNITVIHDFDITTNSSKTLMRVAKDIMNEVQANLDPYLELFSMFSYSMTIISFMVYIMALKYRKKYLFKDSHDNIYITRNFIELDVMRARQGRRTLLPLGRREAYRFIRPGSLYLTRYEKRGYSFSIFNIFRHLLIVTFLVLIDYIIYWVLDMLRYLLQGEVVARAPVMISVAVNGSGYTSEIYTNVVAAFDALQKGNITVVSKKCQLTVSEPDFQAYLLIGLMYGAAFFIAVFGVYMKRLRRSICAHYYPSREQERICYLYNNLLTKRTNIGRALIRSVNMNVADKGHISILLVLAAKFRCFRWFAQFMGVNQEYCMACAKISLGIENEDFVPCITNGCKGLYCQGCYELLDNVCTICMAPLAFTEAMNEEIDSSDEEKILLWVEAMKSIKQKEKEKRKKMKRLLRARLREVITSSGSSSVFSDELLRKYGMKTEEEEDEDEDMETSEAQSGQESGETDFEYQDKSDTSDASEPETQSLVPQIKLPDPRRQADLVSPVLFGQMISMNTRRWQEADVEKGVSGK